MRSVKKEMLDDLKQFLFKGKKGPPDPEQCWPWPGDVSPDGYGIYRCEGRDFQAHRTAAILFGPRVILPDMILVHTCGNMLCCNPHHIRIKDSASGHTYDCLGKESVIPEKFQPERHIFGNSEQLNPAR